jgi:signal transduction histidine kinase/FixJ family two-component response regulator
MNKILIFFLLCGLFPISSYAVSSLSLTDEQQSYSLNFDILEDKTGELTITDVTKDDITQRFSPVKTTLATYGYTRSAYWVKFKITNEAKKTDKWYLYLPYPNIQHIDFCTPDTEKTTFNCKRTGIYYPFSSHELPYSNFIFTVPLITGESKTFYMRFQSDSTIFIALNIYSLTDLMEKISWQQLILGGIYGYFILISFYNIFLWITFKENSYLYYILFNLSSILLLCSLNGSAVQYIWTDNPGFNRFSIPANIIISIIMFINFTDKLLNDKRRNKFLYKINKLQIIILLFLFIFFIVSNNYSITVRIASLIFIFASITSLIMGVLLWYQGYRPARYFVLAWLAPMLQIIHNIMLRFDLLPINKITQFLLSDEVNLAKFVILSSFLSLALMDKINVVIEEREKALDEKNTLILGQNIILEKQVKQRTIELELAKEKSEFANKAKSSFLTNMNHELRTPLNGILGYAQILKLDKNIMQFKQAETGLNIIERSGTHLLNLINDILNISKIEAQKMELNLSDFNLAEMLASLCAIIDVRAKQKNISVKLNMPPNLPTHVIGDEKKLTEVLLNLLSNAVKFTDAGEVILQVQRLKQTAQAIEYRFTVIDSGVGIAESDLSDIFEAFKQVGEKNRKAEGTGLGLTISYKLVQLMGGNLQVKSDTEQGSVFWFDLTLPLADNIQLNNVNQNKQLFASRQIIGYQGKRQRILIVDDITDNRLVLTSLLTPLGFEIMEANDGRDALEKITNIQPDLIITDLIMPVMSGFEMMRTLRQDKNLCYLKIVSISASSILKSESARNEYNFDAALEKPIQLDRLFKALENQLNIKWIYDDNTNNISENDDDLFNRLLIPESDALALLYEWAQDGNFIKFNKKLDDLTIQYPLFVKKMRQMSQTYQDKEICQFINYCQQEKL